MEIKIYEEKNNPNLIILIGKSVYQMNYPYHIGGLNMYCGENFQLNPNQLKEIKLEWMSHEILLAIIKRLLEQLKNEKLKKALKTIIDLASENQLDIDDYDKSDELYEMAEDQQNDMEIVHQFWNSI